MTAYEHDIYKRYLKNKQTFMVDVYCCSFMLSFLYAYTNSLASERMWCSSEVANCAWKKDDDNDAVAADEEEESREEGKDWVC